MKKKKVIIIGGGSSGLLAADILGSQYEVHIYEKGKSVGRKLLVAGNGGFNLTHHLDNQNLIEQYHPSHFLSQTLTEFDNNALRLWLSELGIPTYVGSSNRVFPEQGIKPIHVLQKIKDRLEHKKVQTHLFHDFQFFSETDSVIFNTKTGIIDVKADAYIFALGGASWSKTGSDGKWMEAFKKMGIQTIPFQSSNCGINIKWDSIFRNQHEGKPLKNIKINVGNFNIKGEALVTKYGLEGNAIYPSVPSIREQLSKSNAVHIHLDLKPNQNKEQLLLKIKDKAIKPKNYGYVFNLDKMSLALIKQFTSKEQYLNPHLYVLAIKHLAIPVDSLRPIEEAISTVGGISIDAINADYSLKGHKQVYVVGEMLNWDAPTGGFLLQGCFSIAHKAAQAILKSL